jgi:type IV secretory pathway ATPase VirB11/archaellum biosynthesis ATPase
MEGDYMDKVKTVIITNKNHIGNTDKHRIYMMYKNKNEIEQLFKVALRINPNEIIVKMF